MNNNSIGEACISSPSVSVGYYNNPIQTEKSFFSKNMVPGAQFDFVKSGDIISLKKNKPAEIIGRKDFQVKIRGVRIDINEIEKTY